VSVDDSAPLIVNAALKEVMDENNPEWKENVLRSATLKDLESDISTPGKHTLKIRAIDPGVVIDKFEIVFGTKKNSYFGSPETLFEK
jgi:hypothetical protein